MGDFGEMVGLRWTVDRDVVRVDRRGRGGGGNDLAGKVWGGLCGTGKRIVPDQGLRTYRMITVIFPALARSLREKGHVDTDCVRVPG